MEQSKWFEIVKREKDNEVFFAARCRPLGLTAYGDTPLGARERLNKMFSLLADACIERLGEE